MILNKTYGGFFSTRAWQTLITTNSFINSGSFFAQNITEILKLQIERERERERERESTGTDMLLSFSRASGRLIHKTSPLPGEINWSKQHVILTPGTAMWTSELQSRVGILRFQYCTSKIQSAVLF